MTDRGTERNAYQRAWRADRRAQGFCLRCGRLNDSVPRWYCRACRRAVAAISTDRARREAAVA